MGSLDLIYLIQMALGIGLVIFVHELGHFIAARLCKVRVETFSLGFGPRLLGWRHGDTRYQVAVLPLGGYCKMAGEEQMGDGLPVAHDDLRSKTVGQRFFIYSGGVIMNVIFALVVFPIILMYGVPFAPPIIGDVVPGGPAWRAGIEPGAEVVSVNGHEAIGFSFIPHEIALGPAGPARLEILDPGAKKPRLVLVEPEYKKDPGFRTIGIVAAVDPEGKLAVSEGSPAWEAGLRSDDRLIRVDGPLPELPLEDQLYLATRDGQAVTVTVLRNGSELSFELAPETRPPDARQGPMLGVGPVLNRVAGLRPNATLERIGLAEEDRILSVNGRELLHPHDLELALVSEPGPSRWVVERGQRRLELDGPALDRAEALALAGDVGLLADLDASRVVVVSGSAARSAGLLDGDRIVQVDGTPVRTWDDIQGHAKRAGRAGAALRIDVQRSLEDGSSKLLEFHVEPSVPSTPYYGAGLRPALYEYRADSALQAIRVGIRGSWKFLVDAWTTVKRILMGQVSGNNIGGIISIGVVSYNWASLGLTKLLFFLCMLSVNLAFLNVLPIPVLDGGHLVFLIIEKIKGSPVSERVFGYSQMVGIVLILSLMIYVTYNDLARWTGLFD